VTELDRAALQGQWVHAHEEDTDSELVYRPASYSLPPSRGRSALDLRADGTYVETSRVTLGEYLRSWLEQLAGSGEIRPTTWKTYEVSARLHVIPRIGTIPLQHLTRGDIKGLYQQLRTQAVSPRAMHGLSPKATHNVHLALHRALSDAVEDGLLRNNPASRAHRMSADTPEMNVWSAQEVQLFLDSLRDAPDFALWRLAANTGLRRGEMLGLRWRDVDFEHLRMSVAQQLVRSGDRLAFGPPKTRSGRRLISIDQITATAVQTHRRRQDAERLRLGPGYGDLDLVFCHPDGSPCDPDVISHQFVRHSLKAGLRRIRLHDLRHTHASLALQAGVHPKVVQERLGHSSIKVTLDLYSHVTPGLQDDAASRIAALIDRRISAS